ncbi:formin-like protein 11 [Coffea arabica]|uniref:Formin-like protein n=1 Tax=Coffea arabica TaxID=13443 RepID=A0A6P6W0M6_COFAR|nr:formin-like protein 11 [Coffea arabica]
MDHGSQILHMIFLIIFFLISFHCTHILIANDALNAVEYFSRHGLNEVYYKRGSRHGREKYIGEVSGGDENKEQKTTSLEKFRLLLGMKNFFIRKPRDGHAENYLHSPSPCPSPAFAAEAPAPSPVQPVHRHLYHPSHHHHLVPPAHKIQKKENGGARRILTAVIVSTGVGSLLCAFGLFWGCKRFRKRRKRRTTRTLSIYCSEAGSRSSSKHSQTSVKKVSSDPGPDLFYLESLGAALEPQPFSLKQNSLALNAYSNQNTQFVSVSERERSGHEFTRAEADNDSDGCSAVAEISSAAEISELNQNVPDSCNYSSCGDNVVPEEDDSSDDESFHSLCNSQASDVRLSDASAGSVSGLSEILSANASKKSDCSLASPSHFSTVSPSSSSDSNSEANTILIQPTRLPPPPPSPPPPFPMISHVHTTSPKSTFTSERKTLKNVSSSTSSDASSTGNSDSSSVSNQTPQCSLSPSSPNLPKAPQGIPLPPCPPPFSKGNANSLKIPPPPPSRLSQFTPLGKDGTPLPKLKPLHWDKVRAAPDRSTVWDKLRSSSFEFDEEMIESLFGYNLQNSIKNEEVKTKTSSPSKHVLEPKRLQNITILSKALNVTAEQVCQALMQGSGLALQELEALSKMVPTKEEEAKLSNYRGDINELGSAEKLVKAMLKIPFAFLRIEAMLYRETFDDEVNHLRKSFSMLEEACKELRSSRLFLKLLEAVLKTGNRMNVGTIRGGAKAFKLDALLKLADVKGTDGKTTLLHFVVQEIIRSEGFRVSESIMGKINQRSKGRNNEDKEEEYKRMGLDLVSGLSTELCNVKKTATIDLDVLASSVSNLSDGMTKLQHLVHKDLSMEEKNGNFVQSMRSFLGYAEKNLEELQEDENSVLLHVREITEYFHGDVSKDESNPLRIFVIVRDFLALLDHVCKELRSLKIPSSPNPLAPFR